MERERIVNCMVCEARPCLLLILRLVSINVVTLVRVCISQVLRFAVPNRPCGKEVNAKGRAFSAMRSFVVTNRPRFSKDATQLLN